MVAWADVAKWTSKYWAYCTASFLCLVIVALMAGACGSVWYREKTSGQIYDMATSRRGNFFSYEIRYYMFHLEYEQQLQGPNDSLISIQPTVSCDYTEPNCPAVMRTRSATRCPPPTSATHIFFNNRKKEI
jgi:hypothetical protein